MEPEGASERELAKLVPDHGFGDVDGHMLAAVVNGDGVTDHVGDDRRAARPRLDDPLLAFAVELVESAEQALLYERTLLQAARHDVTSERRAYAGGG